jgi:hypothetical protein
LPLRLPHGHLSTTALEECQSDPAVEGKVENIFTQKRTLLPSPPRYQPYRPDLLLIDSQRTVVDQGKHGLSFLRFAPAGYICHNYLYR